MQYLLQQAIRNAPRDALSSSAVEEAKIVSCVRGSIYESGSDLREIHPPIAVVYYGIDEHNFKMCISEGMPMVFRPGRRLLCSITSDEFFHTECAKGYGGMIPHLG